MVTKVNPTTDTATVAFVGARGLAGYKYACNNSGTWSDWGHPFETCECSGGFYWDGANGCLLKQGVTEVNVWNAKVPVSTIKSECNRLGGTYDDAKYLCNHPTKTFVVSRFEPDYSNTPTFAMVDTNTLNKYNLMCATSGSGWMHAAGVMYCHCFSESMVWDERVGCAVQNHADWAVDDCNHFGIFDTATRGCRCNSINTYGVNEHAVFGYRHNCIACSDLNAIYVSGVGLDGVCQTCPDKVDVENNTCVTSCKTNQKYIEKNGYNAQTIHLCVPASYNEN